MFQAWLWRPAQNNDMARIVGGAEKRNEFFVRAPKASRRKNFFFFLCSGFEFLKIKYKNVCWKYIYTTNWWACPAPGPHCFTMFIPQLVADLWSFWHSQPSSMRISFLSNMAPLIICKRLIYYCVWLYGIKCSKVYTYYY